MADDEEKLPRELIEEILSRVPPTSLVRLRTVCKRWNSLINDKTFINNHKSTFRFVLVTKSKIYSVSIDPKIVARELTLDLPGLGKESHIPHSVADCDEFLLCGIGNGSNVVWNPWLNQTSLIKADVSQPGLQINAIGYVENKIEGIVKRGYKTVGSYRKRLDIYSKWKTYDFASDTWKDRQIDLESTATSHEDSKPLWLLTKNGVSLNGTLYWIGYYKRNDPSYCLDSFDFSSESFCWIRHLPCGATHLGDALVLRVFKGDRLSLLKQCYETKKIEVWVTKDKIDNKDDDDVEWMPFMTFSGSNLPGLVVVREGYYIQPSYFLEDKRLVVCCCDESGQAWIYILGENKLMSKDKIASVVDLWPLHCTYFPSLISVPPPCQREEAETHV